MWKCENVYYHHILISEWSLKENKYKNITEIYPKTIIKKIWIYMTIRFVRKQIGNTLIFAENENKVPIITIGPHWPGLVSNISTFI